MRIDAEPESTARAMTAYNTILVAIDGSEPSARALDEAVRLVKAQGGKLQIVHIGVPEGGKQILADALKSAQQAGVPAEANVVEGIGGRTATFIIDEANRCSADLIVVGTHGRRGVRRLLIGSDAEGIVRSSPVPVLVVHGEQ
jgi:nucleotide-binding universal stress UspA family protein